MNERETGRTADVETQGDMQADTEREKKTMEGRGEDKMGREKKIEEARLALTRAFVEAQRVPCRASVFMEQPAAQQGPLGYGGPNSSVTLSLRAGRS